MPMGRLPEDGFGINTMINKAMADGTSPSASMKANMTARVWRTGSERNW
jgi:hypothetical protein